MNDTSLRHAGLILIGTTVLAKVVGFLREAVIASAYGTSHTVDVYLAAMTLPAMAATIVFHSIPNAFVPLFSGTSGHGQVRRQAWGFLGVSCLLSAGIWFLAEPIAALTNSGFPAALRSETVVILRITTVAIALATIEALTRSRLLAQRRFVRPGLSLMWQSVVMIVAVWLYPDGGARTLAWGFVAGGAAAALWNLIPTGAFRKPASPDLRTGTVAADQRRIGLWVPIILLADSIPQLYAVIDRHLGSYLAEGSIAALQYANLIVVLPVSICGLTLGTAIFPYLSSAIVARDMDRAREILDKAVRWSLIVVVPVTVWILFFCQEITSLIYERGAFGQQSRLLTASTLLAYAIGLIPNVLMAILAKVFYASRRWGPVMLASIMSVAIKWILSVWWVEDHRTLGLAVATSAGTLAGASVLFVALSRQFQAGRWRHWVQTALTLGAICAICCAATTWMLTMLPDQPNRLSVIARIGSGVIASTVVLFSISPRLGLTEIGALKGTFKVLKNRIGR